MYITTITGSPHKNGTTNLLADKFMEGAKKAGHYVFSFNAAFEDVKPCMGCDYCIANNLKCIHNDSMNKLYNEIIRSDIVVFVTPLYFWGMSAQLKIVVDRLYPIKNKIIGNNKKAMLMAASYDAKDWTMEALVAHYKTIIRYLEWKDAGILLATGCGNRSDIENTDYPDQAYKMGKNI